MTPGGSDDRPVRLSERLKQLDDAQYSGEPWSFDLGAVISSGRRRRRRRAVVGVVGAVGTMAAAVVMAANIVLPGSLQETVRPDADPPPAVVVDSRQRGMSYVQSENNVTAYHDGDVVATLTLSSVTYTSNGGRLLLTVAADQDFRFSASDFIWENEEGTDRGPVDSSQVVQVAGQRTQSVVIDFQQSGKGTVFWAPGADHIAGAWLISKSAAPVQSPKAAWVAHLQRGDTVSVYKDADLVAAITLTASDDAKGRLVFSVNARQDLDFRADQFIWEGRGGKDNNPVNGGQVLHVDAQTTKNLEIKFRKPGTGAILWAPEQNAKVAGVWIREP
jgi:hypothetical protein